jgi:hypothetical protein
VIGLLRAEVVKLTGRKLYPVMVVILGALVALTAFFLLIFGQINEGAVEEGLPLVMKPEAYIFGVQQVIGQTWFPLILAVVVLGGELASTIWATSLTRESSKAKHIGARLLIFTVASWIGMGIGIAFWSVITALFAEGEGTLSVVEWLDVAWKTGVTQVAWVALGLGFVALLRSVGPAIGAVLAISFGESLLALWQPYQNVSLTGASTAIFGNVGMPDVVAEMFGFNSVTLLHAMLIIAGWTALGLLLTWWGLNRRDA